MKKIAVLLLSTVMLLSFGLTAYGAELTTGDANSTTATVVSNGEVTPFSWYYSYEKTVTRYYLFLESVPEQIYYSEYDSGMKVTCTGYLDLQNIMVLGDGSYKVTFKGTIGAYIF